MIFTVKNNKYGNVEVIIDDEDYDLVKNYLWYLHKTNSGFYIRGYKNNKFIYLHRLIMNAKPKQFIDHKNHNTLDNRKINLRCCTIKENGRNVRKTKNKTSSKYKGVTFFKRDKKWQAKIQVDGRTIHLGYFVQEIDAAVAYDNAAKKYFKTFAKTNF